MMDLYQLTLVTKVGRNGGMVVAKGTPEEVGLDIKEL